MKPPVWTDRRIIAEIKELRQEMDRLRAQSFTYRADVERLRRDNIALQKIIQTQRGALKHAEEGYGY